MRLTSSIWWEEVAQKLYGTLFCPDKYLTHRIQQPIPKLRILNFQKNQPIRLFLTNNIIILYKTSWSKIYLLCNSQILLELPTTPYFLLMLKQKSDVEKNQTELNKTTFLWLESPSKLSKITYWSFCVVNTNQRLMILIDPSLQKSLNLGLW